jgi:hypothetical protein
MTGDDASARRPGPASGRFLHPYYFILVAPDQRAWDVLPERARALADRLQHGHDRFVDGARTGRRQLRLTVETRGPDLG